MWNIIISGLGYAFLSIIILGIIEIILNAVGRSLFRWLLRPIVKWFQVWKSNRWPIEMNVLFHIRMFQRVDERRFKSEILKFAKRTDKEVRWVDDQIRFIHADSEGNRNTFSLIAVRDYRPMIDGKTDEMESLDIHKIQIQASSNFTFRDLHDAIDSIKTVSERIGNILVDNFQVPYKIEHPRFVIYTKDKFFDVPSWMKQKGFENKIYVRGKEDIDICLFDNRIEFSMPEFYKSPVFFRYLRETIAINYHKRLTH